jgi:epoxyqueuosine reductase QueG
VTGAKKEYSDVEVAEGAALREYAASLGAELYGVASAADYAAHFPEKPQPTQFVEGARSIVIVGLPFDPGTIATILRPELAGLRANAIDDVGTEAARPVGAERFFLQDENIMLNLELLHIGYRMAAYLRKAGRKAFYFPPAKQNERFRTAPFYHMPAMYLAGMGTLGLNCSILTPEYGPRFYVTSIITDALLPAGKPLDEELCTHCGLCVENGPIQAIDGDGWKNPHACASYGCCGTCIAICPVGQV